MVGYIKLILLTLINENCLLLMDNCQVQSIYDAYCKYRSDYFVDNYLVEAKHFSWSLSLHGLMEHYSVQDFKEVEMLLAPGRVLIAQENGPVLCQVQ